MVTEMQVMLLRLHAASRAIPSSGGDCKPGQLVCGPSPRKRRHCGLLVLIAWLFILVTVASSSLFSTDNTTVNATMGASSYFHICTVEGSTFDRRQTEGRS
jgi:hypothetical protein